MKKAANIILFVLTLALMLLAAACTNEPNSAKSASDTDTLNRVTPPPSDNSHATNPSLADTVYHNKDSVKTKDSIR